MFGSYSRKDATLAATSLKSPARIFAVGTVSVSIRLFFSRLRSYPPKKNRAFFLIGPPTVPPMMSRLPFGFLLAEK